MKWRGDEVMAEIQKKKKTFLYAAGEHTRNQMGEFWHKITGTGANSVNYKLSSGAGSGFESKYGPGEPPLDAELSNSDDPDFVKVGSGLVYAGPQEKLNSWASRSLDRVQADGTLMKIAEEVFKL